jgi:hypothetical protein
MSRREKRELREKQIIRATISLLSDKGFLDVRMSDVAKETNIAMGTIYSHFEGKEDLLVACACTLHLDDRILIHSIFQQPITAIEKIIAAVQTNWLVTQSHPDLIEINNLSLMPSVWRRATPYRVNEMNALHIELAGIFLEVVVEAIHQDIGCYEDMNSEELGKLCNYFTHGMWGLCVGLSSTAQSGYSSTLCPDSEDDSYQHFTTNYINFLKGYGWREENPEAVFNRCLKIANEGLEQTEWFSKPAKQTGASSCD